MTDSQTLAKWAAEAATEEKALDIVTLDIREVSIIADYFVICSGRSTVHAKAITEQIEDFLKKQGVTVLHREGKREGLWMLLDYGSVVIHVFREEERQFYGLERLWADAQLVEAVQEDEGLTHEGLTFPNP